MALHTKQAKFDFFRKSLAAANLSTSDTNALICPLCWQETCYNDLTLEHTVPSSVGGRQTVLTCRRCNNEHGQYLDSHLTHFQRINDAAKGHGIIKTRLNINGHEMAANLEIGNGKKSFRIIEKATSPAASAGSLEEFKKGNVRQITATIYFNYCKNNYKTATMRSAYLVLFKCFGYEYARHDIVQSIRQRIVNHKLEHPNIDTLTFEVGNFNPPFDRQHFVIPGKANGLGFYLVIIRVRRETTTYLGTWMPAPTDRHDDFFRTMELVSEELNDAQLPIPQSLIFC